MALLLPLLNFKSYRLGSFFLSSIRRASPPIVFYLNTKNQKVVISMFLIIVTLFLTSVLLAACTSFINEFIIKPLMKSVFPIKIKRKRKHT